MRSIKPLATLAGRQLDVKIRHRAIPIGMMLDGLDKRRKTRPPKKRKKIMKSVCEHKNRRVLVGAQYGELGSSSGYMSRRALLWCTKCGAWANEVYDVWHTREKRKWHLPSLSKKH